MPTTKKENLLYNIIVCTMMTYLMTIINFLIHSGDMSINTIWQGTKSWPLSFAFGFIIATFIISKFALLATTYFCSIEDSKNSRIMFMTFFMVTGMSILMSIFRAIISAGFSSSAFIIFLNNWPRNFCIAFFLQLLLVGPLARKLIMGVRK